MGKGNKKVKNRLIFDRCLVIFCTIMVMISCACTVYIVKQEREGAKKDSTGQALELNDNEQENITEIYAEYKGSGCYTDTYLSKKAIKVYAIYKDGTKKEISDWEGEIGPVVRGNNAFTIKYGKFETVLNVNGVDLNSVSQAINYNIYSYDVIRAQYLVKDVNAGKITYSELFDGVLFCGDSRTKAIVNWVGKEKILAENGVGLEHLETYMEELLSRNPKTLILNYGINSMSTSSEAREEFIQQYKELLEEIQNALPQTRIIVAGVLPVSDDFVVEQPRMNYIDITNIKLFKVCVELGIEFIDGSAIVENDATLFNYDGLHFDDDFYTDHWLPEIVEEMGVGAIVFE